MNKNTIIVLGFPGTGKSTFCENTDMDVSDSDSSLFSWQDITNRIRHPEWPDNYIEHIKSLIGTCDVIFVSTHKEVRRALAVDPALERRCYTVIPSYESLPVYVENYTGRGNSLDFVQFMADNWEALRDDTFRHGVGRRIILKPGEYIGDELMGRLTAKEVSCR